MLIRLCVICLSLLTFSFQHSYHRQEDGSYLPERTRSEFIEFWDRIYLVCPREVDQIFYEEVGVPYLDFREWYVTLPDGGFPEPYKKQKKNIVLCDTPE